MFEYINISRCILASSLHQRKELEMITNVGGPDRAIRLVLAAAIVGAALFSGLPLFADPLWLWGSIGVAAILAVTALLRFCPLYAPFGISTCRRPTNT